jgi:hypothetical protein
MVWRSDQILTGLPAKSRLLLNATRLARRSLGREYPVHVNYS